MTRVACSSCKKRKPATSEHFSPDARKKNGLQSRCRPCRAEYARRNHHGRYKGIIDSESLRRIKAKTKACVICGRKGKLVVDHCHAQNVVRGMLCQTCNRGLGHFYDDPDLMEFAAAYLRAWAREASCQASGTSNATTIGG